MRSVFFAVTYVVMLGAALYHGLFGLRNILLELNPGDGLRKSIDVALAGLGLALFAFGGLGRRHGPARRRPVGG